MNFIARFKFYFQSMSDAAGRRNFNDAYKQLVTHLASWPLLLSKINILCTFNSIH